MTDLKTPPHSEEAERGVLGSILLDPSVIDNCIRMGLKPSHFFNKQYELLYSELIDMFSEDEAMDALLIAERLKAKKILERVGGFAGLASLQDEVLVSKHSEHYSEIVKEKAHYRYAIDSARSCIERSYRAEAAPEIITSETAAELCEFGTFSSSGLPDMVREQLEIDRKIIAGERVGLPLPWEHAQKVTHGIPLSAVTPLAGRDGICKSRLVTWLAMYWLTKHNISGLYFPFEDTQGRFLRNCAATIGGYDGFHLYGGVPSSGFISKHEECMETVSKLPMEVYDAPCSADEISSIIASARRRLGIEWVVIDGWKDIALRGDNQVAAEGAAMAELVRASKINKVGLIPIMHLRDVEDDRWISKRHIRGNKVLSQSSRMAILLQDQGIDGAYMAKRNMVYGDLVFDVAKCSYGHKTMVAIRPDLETGTFVEL